MSKQPDTLVTCPLCDTPNIYSKALKAHQRSKNCANRAARAKRLTDAAQKGAKPLTLAGLDAMGAAAMIGESEDGLLGRQLSEQWDKVVGGQREQLVFGAMMMKLRARIATGSACGASKASHDPTKKGTGLKGWLKEHAPRVAESTAYRLMEIAEGVRAEFKLGAKVDLELLLAAQIENLDGALAKKRAAIEQCIEGQSQRQLLLTFGKEAKLRGGDTSGKAEKLTPEEQRALDLQNLREDATAPFKLLSELGDKWHVFNDAEGEGAIDIAEAWLVKAKAWFKTPKSKRPVADAVKQLIDAK